MKVMPKFRRHNPPPAVATRQIIADQALRLVISITLCRINQVEAVFRRLIENGIYLALLKFPPPFTPELPCPNSNDRNIQSGLSQLSIFHFNSTHHFDPILPSISHSPA